MSTRKNALDQALDIAGSLTQSSSAVLADEPSFFGSPLSGQSGSTATISAFSAGITTMTGLTGMTTASVGNFLTVSGAATGANNGTFLISAFISATSVDIVNASGVFPDANSGALVWTERRPYSLEDDLNYVRTDRAAIKGVAFSAAIPTYDRPTAVGTFVPANLANIAGKTTDAKALVINRKFNSAAVVTSDGYITVTSTSNLKHADATDRTGVPIHDGADSGNLLASYVEIIDPTTEAGIEVLAGTYDGYRVYGRSRAGTSGVSPNSIEVEFRAVQKGADLSTSVAYTWEAGQPSSVDLYYGFRERLDNLTETALRTVLTNGIVSDADTAFDITDIRTTIGIGDNVTDLAGLLTNTTNFYPFVNLPDGTPSVVEALNTLNTQIGNRDYTGGILTDGYTITQSLQQLSSAITSASALRVIERLAADIPAGTAHTLPFANTYTVDVSNQGLYLSVWTRGLLRDPGPVTGNNDYAETSTSSVTFYSKLKAADHINYIIRQP